MEENKRILNVNFYRSGSGSISSKITLPISILRKMGFSEDDRKAEMIYEEKKNQIILKKL